ncbi:phage tail protein [Mammaliicoccus sciuri]|uniref:phage tail protein n=1 Tax=Mammaliicoccus sciuri TaxID=1296 RepID=UPI000D1F1223|nr:phage tail protein [Mammaliicoccus sciuri]PTJ54177.1 hypothetical protein BU012_00855 [Mammaliicoccus sciuri]
MTQVIARNLQGDEFVVSAQSEQTLELNGNQSIQLTIPPNKINDAFIHDIDSMWEIDFYGDTYTVVYAKKNARGGSFYIDIRAIHKALDRLDSIRTYERFDGYINSTDAFFKVFADTGYTFVQLATFPSIEIEGLGDGETKLESFKRLIERFKAEFYISGTTFYLDSYIGRDVGFEYRYKLNASNVQEETDGTSTYTFVRGFGDYEESEQNVVEKAKIKRQYESPLAKILGRRHAPMVAKGSFKTTSAIDKAMKEVVDNSVTISVSADVKDLRLQGYPYAQPELGDRVFLNDKRIDFNQEVRVVEIKIDRYANGNVRNINVVFGNQKLGRRYSSNLSSAVAKLNALLDGRLQLNFDVLDQRSKEMLRKIMSVDTELTLDNGIFAVDKNNPNNVVGLNSAGWFISRDGGNTAEVIATADGITANAITSGTINTANITIYGGRSTDTYISIRNNELNARGRYTTTWQGTTRTYDTQIVLQKGYIKMRNVDDNRMLYYTQHGISTYADGTQDESSGTLEFFSYDYDPIRKGVTLSSVGGVVALRSGLEKVIIDAYDSAYIRSKEQRVKIQPRTSVSGNNTFEYHVVDNEVIGNNDGIIYYGSENNPTPSVGLRFSKAYNGKTLYVTDGSGLRGTGNLEVHDMKVNGRMVGDIQAINDNVYARVDNALKIVSKSSTEVLRDFEARNAIMNDVILNSIRTSTPYENTYIGVGSSELRITTNEFYNDGNPVYRPVRAESFVNASYSEYKEDITEWNYDALSVIANELKLYSYKFKTTENLGDRHINHGLVVGDGYETPPEFVRSGGVDLYELIAWSLRAIQQLDDKLERMQKDGEK